MKMKGFEFMENHQGSQFRITQHFDIYNMWCAEMQIENQNPAPAACNSPGTGLGTGGKGKLIALVGVKRSCQSISNQYYSLTALGTERPPGTTNATTHEKNTKLGTSTDSHLFWKSLITFSLVSATTWNKSHPHQA